MKTYDETMAAIFSKGDAIFAEKNARVRNIKRTSAAVSGVCAAAIVGFTVFRNDDIKNAGNLNNHNDSIITENEQTTSGTNTVSSTTTKTATSTSMITTKTTSHTSKKATSASTTITKTSANSIDDTSNNKEHTIIFPINEEKIQTTNSIEITDIHTTTATTEKITESTTQTTSIELCEIFNNFVFTFSNGDAAVSNEPESLELYYINDTVEKEELSGSFIQQSLQKQYFDGDKLVDIETYSEFFYIKDYSPDVMLAVKFEDSDKYYRYINKSYHPYSIGNFIYAFSLTANDLSNEIYLNEQFLTDCDTKIAWELLTADLSLPNKTTYCQNNGIVPNNSLLFRFESSSKTWLKGSIGIDLRGYIWITINDILTNSFYIGEERANEIFEYYN